MGNVNRTKFIGKEKDKESNYADHGVRKYDDELGRFTSIDPLWEKYYSWTPYHYSLNNPVSLFDKDGFAPGDLFESVLDAVIDFAIIYNPLSINEKREYGTKLYSVKTESGKTMYSYVEPLPGYNDGSSSFSDIPKETPEGTKAKGTLHTHGDWDSRLKDKKNCFGDKDMNDHLTDGDLYNAKYDFKMPVWGVFPSGKIEMWNPKENTKLNKIKLDILLPCDVNSPNREKNNNTVNDVKKQIDFLKKQIDFLIKQIP